MADPTLNARPGAMTPVPARRRRRPTIDRRGGRSPFLGVPIPIKDLTPSPVARHNGSHGAPEAPSEVSELVVDALARAGSCCGGTNTPAFGVITAAENTRHGITAPLGHEIAPRAVPAASRRGGCGGMFPIAHANDGGGSIRNLLLLWARRAEAEPRSCARARQSWLGAVSEGVVTRTVADSAAGARPISAVDPLPGTNAPPPAGSHRRPRDPGRLRID